MERYRKLMVERVDGKKAVDNHLRWTHCWYKVDQSQRREHELWGNGAKVEEYFQMWMVYAGIGDR